jgi:hypothetical protein
MHIQLLTSDILPHLENHNGFWYLATPYTKYHRDLDSACQMACIAAAFLTKHNITVFCPIAHSHLIAKYGNINPTDADFWMKLDDKFLAITRGLVVLNAPGWRESFGVNAEIETIKKYDKPIYLLDWDDERFVININ